MYRNGKMNLKHDFLKYIFECSFWSYSSYKFFKIDWTLNKLVLFQKMMSLVLNFTSDWIFAWQNMASIGDFWGQKVTQFETVLNESFDNRVLNKPLHLHYQQLLSEIKIPKIIPMGNCQFPIGRWNFIWDIQRHEGHCAFLWEFEFSHGEYTFFLNYLTRQLISGIM